MEVKCQVNILEVDGVDDYSVTKDQKLDVYSHWNYNDRVVLKFPDSEKTFTVLSADLLKAVKNAENH